MKAGTLRHYVSIMLPSSDTGDRGQRTGEPTTIVENMPCSIRSLAGREVETAKQVMATASHKITMRYFPGLTTQHYLVWQGAEDDEPIQYNIGWINDLDQRHLFL